MKHKAVSTDLAEPDGVRGQEHRMDHHTATCLIQTRTSPRGRAKTYSRS